MLECLHRTEQNISTSFIAPLLSVCTARLSRSHVVEMENGYAFPQNLRDSSSEESTRKRKAT